MQSSAVGSSTTNAHDWVFNHVHIPKLQRLLSGDVPHSVLNTNHAISLWRSIIPFVGGWGSSGGIDDHLLGVMTLGREVPQAVFRTLSMQLQLHNVVRLFRLWTQGMPREGGRLRREGWPIPLNRDVNQPVCLSSERSLSKVEVCPVKHKHRPTTKDGKKLPHPAVASKLVRSVNSVRQAFPDPREPLPNSTNQNPLRPRTMQVKTKTKLFPQNERKKE